MRSRAIQVTLLLALVLATSARGIADDNGPRGLPASLPHISTETYQEQLSHSRELVESCRTHTDLCEAEDVSDDEMVDRQNGGAFAARWYWLRDVLEKAKSAVTPDRSAILEQAMSRLKEDATDVGVSEPLPMSQARKQTDDILGRMEFREVHQDNYLGQKIAACFLLLDTLFSRAGSYLPRPSWFASLLAWTLLILACSSLLIWAWRVRKQQRLVIATDVKATVGVWQNESDNWAERAQNEAERGDWREAVHCLYWSAIVMLEGQKRWRQNRARTPREYLTLLEEGSTRQQTLLGLTRIFERIWYGLRPAAKSDYERAKSMLEELRAA